MSGICAVWRQQNPERVAETLASFHAGLSIVGEERFAREIDQGAGVGVSARFDEHQIYKDDRVLLACDADVLNEKDLAREAGIAPALRREAKTAALLAALYARFGSGFWSRGNGWDFAAIVRMLQYLPMNHPDRPRFEQLFKDMAGKKISLQKPDGKW